MYIQYTMPTEIVHRRKKEFKKRRYVEREKIEIKHKLFLSLS